MVEPEETLRDSPVDFDSAVAYALQPAMRRLIILYIVGALLLPVGLSVFLSPSGGDPVGLVVGLVGLAVAVVGAALLFGGVIGAVFKLVTDANILANQTAREG